MGLQPGGSRPSQAAPGGSAGPSHTTPEEAPGEGLSDWQEVSLPVQGHHQHQEPATAGQDVPSQGLAESQWQDRGPVPRRYLAAGLEDDEDEQDDADAVPSTP